MKREPIKWRKLGQQLVLWWVFRCCITIVQNCLMMSMISLFCYLLVCLYHPSDCSHIPFTCAYFHTLLMFFCKRYFHPKPQFFYYDDADGTVCSIILPANAPVHQIVSSPKSSAEAAKRDACLRACKALHEIGALNDYLLPEQDAKHEESSQGLSDFDGNNGWWKT